MHDVNKFIILVIFVALFSLVFSAQSFALQQVAGKLEANLGSGQSSIINWGLISDNPSKVITVELYAEGKGSEFLSFPKKVDLDPKMIKMIPITVTIPKTFEQKTTLSPTIFAVEKGEQGGPTVINIQMKKVLTLNIGSQQIEKEPIKETSVQQEEQKTEKSLVPDPEPTSVCGEGTVLKDGKCVVATQPKPKSGGCLIATAAYGSELAPQVQFLREIRDNTVLSTSSGSSFMTVFNDVYYSFSPTIADWERENLYSKKE